MLDDFCSRGHRSAVVMRPAAAVPLHAMVTSAGFELRTSPTYDWDGRRRGDLPFGLFQLTLDGRGHLRRDGREHRLGPGEAMLVAIPDDHRYWVAPGERWEHAWCCFNGREALRLWRVIRRRLGPVHRFAADDPAIDAFADLLTAAVDEGADPYRLSGLLYHFLMTLSALLGDAGDLPSEVAAAVDLGRRRLADPIGVDDLAAAAGLSRHHFSRRFKEAVGQSPGSWLQAERLAAAARLLTTDLDLAAIAERCGFSDANYLGKAFRKAYGTSPGAFRRAGL